MYIADTIVPWTAEWLAHYEIWLATDDWRGGGVWPPVRSTADAAEPLDRQTKDQPAV